MLTCHDVADYFLALTDQADAGEGLSNLKQQKLCYCAQGVHLALTGKPLFGEPIEAWAHGPAVPTLFREQEQFGSGPVPLSRHIDLGRYDSRTRELLDEVFTVYGQYSAWRLRDIARDEAPWRDTPRGEVIPLDAMRRYFETQLVPQ